MLALLLLLFFVGAATAQEPYRTAGECAGLPKLPVRAAKGLCVGLLAGKLGFARNVLVLPGGDLLVVDMANWSETRGRVLRLQRQRGAITATTVLLQGLNRPHGIGPAPEGRVYLGVAGQVVSFDPDEADPQATLRIIATGFPTSGNHPVTQFALDRDGALFVNLGSATDRCEPGGAICEEGAERALIKRIVPQAEPVDARSIPPFASGLRNSMGLAVYPRTGLLVQGENGYDLPDRDKPNDELNVIRQGAHYGWPYCAGAQLPVAEFPGYDCKTTVAPQVLLPAHSAPLALLYVPAGTVPGIAGEALVVTLHGARSFGHRVVAFAIDAQGAPYGRMVEVIAGWDLVRGTRPLGTPVGLALDGDGSILVTEDRNGTLLRIARER